MTKKIGLLLGPAAFLALLNLPQLLISDKGDAVLAAALWMVLWWVTEAVSISVTALLPLVLFPLLKVMPMEEVGANYGSPIIFLFFGGFVLALALEKVNLHKRIALNIIKLTGTTPNRVVLGFMLATASLSMWISNTATAVLMLPIALSVIQLLSTDSEGDTQADRNFSISVMLGIAFAANAGGIATIIGTPPNSVLVGLLENEYNTEISFLKWMLIGLPFSALMLCLCYYILVKLMFPCRQLRFSASQEIISQQLKTLGPLKQEEKMVSFIFLCTVSLWIFRSLINQIIPGLQLNDTTISLMGALALFTIPYTPKKWKFVLQWGDTSRLAWGILILFGGGLALAKGMSVSGLVDLVAQTIAQGHMSPFLTTALLIFLMLFMTELMSNVALVALLAPMVAGIAIGLDVPILHLLIPVTMASSCAFMLPMATPPNAIVFASGQLRVSHMVKAGIWLNLLATGLLILFSQWIIPFVF